MPTYGSGVQCNMNGAFTCKIRVHSTRDDVQTGQSRTLQVGKSTHWTYQELIDSGFREGDSCWVSCDIDAGETNHGSGQNFKLIKDVGDDVVYELTGGVWNPSWSIIN